MSMRVTTNKIKDIRRCIHRCEPNCIFNGLLQKIALLMEDMFFGILCFIEGESLVYFNITLFRIVFEDPPLS